jgi:glutamyl-tRNA reductase
VRSETGLGEGAVSVSYAAIALAKKIFGDLSGLNVLVLGAATWRTDGHAPAGAGGEAVDHRQPDVRERRGPRLAAQRTRGPVGRRFGRALSGADIVVTATGSREPVPHARGRRGGMRPRRGRPLFIIDIAVPRDVEPEPAA